MYGKTGWTNRGYTAAGASWYADRMRGGIPDMGQMAKIVELFPELPHIERIASVIQCAAQHTTLGFADVADRFVNSYYVQGAYSTGRRHGYEGDTLLRGMERALRYDLGILGDATYDATMITK